MSHRCFSEPLSGRFRSAVGWRVALFGCAWLLFTVSSPAAAAEDLVGAVNFQEVIEVYDSIMNAPGSDPNTQVGPDPEEVRKLERELRKLKADYARERPGLSPEAKAAHEKRLTEKSAELQRLHSKTLKDVYDMARWRSPEILGARLGERIREYGEEHRYAVILDKERGDLLFQREGWSGPSSDPVEITGPLIEWLRHKEESARPARSPRP